MRYKIKSQQALLNVAEFYCAKRETSRAKLGQYLRRKCREQKIDPEIFEPWIPIVLEACESSKMVDDQRYAGILIRDYTDRGKGKRYVEQKLKEKGIPKDFQQVTIVDEDEYARALRLATKVVASLQTKVSRKAERDSHKPKKPNAFRAHRNEKFEVQQKLTQKLLTSGFSLEISRKVVQQVVNHD